MKHKLQPITKRVNTQNLWPDIQINKQQLKVINVYYQNAGVTQIDRIYDILYVYSKGVHNAFREILEHVEDKQAIMHNLWQIYMRLVLEQGGVKAETPEELCNTAREEVNKHWEKETEDMRKRLIEYSMQVSVKDGLISNLQCKVESLHKSCAEYTLQMQEIEECMNVETRRRLMFENKVNQVNLIYLESLQINEMLQGKVDSLTSINQTQDQVDKQKQKLIEELRDELVTLQENHKKLQSRMIELQICNKISDKQLNEQKSKNNEFKNKQQVESLSYADLQKQYNNLIITHQNIVIENQQLLTKNNEQLVQCKSLTDQVISLKESLQQAQQTNIDYMNATSHAQIQIELTSKQINDRNKQIIDLNGQLLLNEQQYEQLSQERNTLSQQLKQLQYDYDIKLKEIKSLHQSISGMSEQSSQMSAAIEQIQQDYDRSIEMNKQLQYDKKQLSNQTRETMKQSIIIQNDTSNQIALLKEQLIEITNTSEQLSHYNKLITQQNSKLEEQITCVNTELTALQLLYNNEMSDHQISIDKLSLLTSNYAQLEFKYTDCINNIKQKTIQLDELKQLNIQQQSKHTEQVRLINSLVLELDEYKNKPIIYKCNQAVQTHHHQVINQLQQTDQLRQRDATSQCYRSTLTISTQTDTQIMKLDQILTTQTSTQHDYYPIANQPDEQFTQPRCNKYNRPQYRQQRQLTQETQRTSSPKMTMKLKTEQINSSDYQDIPVKVDTSESRLCAQYPSQTSTPRHSRHHTKSVMNSVKFQRLYQNTQLYYQQHHY